MFRQAIQSPSRNQPKHCLLRRPQQEGTAIMHTSELNKNPRTIPVLMRWEAIEAALNYVAAGPSQQAIVQNELNRLKDRADQLSDMTLAFTLFTLAAAASDITLKMPQAITATL